MEGEKMKYLKLTERLKGLLKDALEHIEKGYLRIFMAKIAEALGPGGQRELERELELNRKTIRKGQQELKNGGIQQDDFSGRGRKKTENHFPNLLEDMKEIVDPQSQIDPTFRSTNLYSKATAKEVRKALIEEKGYTGDRWKPLVVDDKWMASMDKDIHSEMDRISQRLT